MKLRLHSHSIRLRLDQEDFRQFSENKRLLEGINIMPPFHFGIRIVEQKEKLSLLQESGCWWFQINDMAWEEFQQPSCYSLESNFSPENLCEVQLLIEKDFQSRKKKKQKEDFVPFDFPPKA